MEGSLSPCSFDIDNAFIRDCDPVMNADDFAIEVDYMFERGTVARSADQFSGVELQIANLKDIFDSEDEENVLAKEGNDKVISIQKSNHFSSQKLSESNFEESDMLVDPVETDCNVADENELQSQMPVIKTTKQPDLHSYAVKKKSQKAVSKAKQIKAQKISSRRNKLIGKKLYEVNCPLADPDAEKCRLNAINAKRNRDRKKAELERAHDEIRLLRRENQRLQEAVETSAEELAETRAELQQIKSMLKVAGLPVDDREE